MSIKHEIRKLIRKTGFDVARFEPQLHPQARRQELFELFGIDLVVDVGANVGQFGEFLRSEIGYRGRIISFEPLSSAYKIVAEKASADAKWETFNFALGDREHRAEINIAGNSYSSSLLPMGQKHIEAAPESGYVGRETIEVRTLDAMFGEIHRAAEHIFLKIDTQGFEDRVLAGGEDSLRLIDTVQLELSLVPVYEGAPLFEDLYSLMLSKGYRLSAMEEVFWHRETGQLLQIDGIFHRF